MNSDACVIVVGGGPAGSAAAIWCAQKGLSALVLEAAPFPRDHPGESLHPGVEPLFRQLGVWSAIESAEFPRYAGNMVAWGGPPRFQAFGCDARGPWLGFHAWRAELDRILLAGAAACGAAVFQPCRALEPIVENGRVAGIRTAGGCLRSRFVIDATGSRHWLARHLGVPILRRSRQLVAMYGYAEAPQDHMPATPSLTGDGRGWTWLAGVRSGVCAWTRLDFESPQTHPPPELVGLAPAVPVRGADVTWRKARNCFGPGYFLAGDAAFMVDPASSHGVLRALMSGLFTADLIARVVHGECTEDAAGITYQEWTNSWFERDVTRLTELYVALNDSMRLSA